MWFIGRSSENYFDHNAGDHEIKCSIGMGCDQRVVLELDDDES